MLDETSGIVDNTPAMPDCLLLQPFFHIYFRLSRIGRQDLGVAQDAATLAVLVAARRMR